MEELFVKLLVDGFQGKGTHTNPLAAIRGLSAAEARKKPAPDVHSVWENLYHVVFWQNVVYEVAQGAEVDWKSLQGKDWPTPDKMDVDDEWEVLCKAFALALDQAEELVKNTPLTKPTPGWTDGTVAKAMLVLAQHNSYHIGQIVTARQLLGKWPPPKETTLG